jgi:P-type Ca2+ transporter type 2C
MSQEGLRVIACSVHEIAGKSVTHDTIPSLTFVGLYAMQDGLREGARTAVADAQRAGARIAMITGDHKVTAQAIAFDAGIYRPGDGVITGDELNALSDEELASRIHDISVFARVSPEHKLRIVRAYKSNGDIVAMTGDGVNDALSLVAADLGVSMGRGGTEVAKEASDIVLLDDNIRSIVAAIEEGRSVYKTIKKVILYLFSTSLGEVLTIKTAILLGWKLPLLPTQIIWLNMVTDGFLVASLAMEPKERNLLNGTFRRPGRFIIDKLMAWRMALMSITMMLGTLFLFRDYFVDNIELGWTISLTTLAVFQWFNAWNVRSETESIFSMNPFSNLYLVGATILVVTLQLVAVYTPFMNMVLNTTPLELSHWIMILTVASSIVLVEEIRKLIVRMRRGI